MQVTRAVQVVLGEGEPGILRLILEAQGFHVVGHARSDDELRQVVDLTDPSVIVLDAGISALAAIDVQLRADGVPIVVVWPRDAFTPVAEERIDPSSAILELGNAVRRVVERHADTVRIPDAPEPAEPIDTAPLAAPTVPSRPSRAARRRHALVVATAWVLALSTLATIGLAVPSALRGLDVAGTIHPSIGHRPEHALTQDREGPGRGQRRDEVVEEHGCAAREDTPTGPRSGRGRPDDPGRGCGQGRGNPDAKGGHGHGGGRPDDPGPSSGQGNGPDQQTGPSKGTGSGDQGSTGSGGGDDDGEDAGNGSGDGGGKGRKDDGPRGKGHETAPDAAVRGKGKHD